MRPCLMIAVCACTGLLCLMGCKGEKPGVSKGASAPSRESARDTASEKPAGATENVALKKSYTVLPAPSGYATTYQTDVTDGKKPLSAESCFGFKKENMPLDVTIDIDLGTGEKIAGATLYTFYDSFDKENNSCAYGANYVEVYGSDTGKFSGEQVLIGKAGDKNSMPGDPGMGILMVEGTPRKCRLVRFVVTKNFGDPGSATDWLFIKEAEVWKAAK